MNQQKAKYIGGKDKIYCLNKYLFPHGVWKEINKDQIKRIVEYGDCEKFEFKPPIDISNFVASGPIEGKPKRRRKKKEKED